MAKTIVLKEVDLSDVIITRIRDLGNVVSIFLEDPETGKEFSVSIGKRHFELLSEDELLYELWKIVQDRKIGSTTQSDKVEKLAKRYFEIKSSGNMLKLTKKV